jgi:hypothetical protein
MSLLKVRHVFAVNRWLRWQAFLACVIIANGIRVVAGWPTPATWWSVLLAPLLLVPFLVCMVMALRLSDAQRRQREVERDAAAALRTLRAPDAGPGQCPVCGMDDLDRLAADDGFMERGPDRSKVVAYGRRRAHRGCAEFVPYVAPPTPLGVHYTCRFCGEGRHAPSMKVAEARLIAHSKTCPMRTAPGEPVLTGKLRASVVDAEMRAIDECLRKAQADLGWLSADLNGWRD